MVKTAIGVCLSVVLLTITPSKGSFCTKQGMYYAVQTYCAHVEDVWGWWCWRTATRLIRVYERYKTCCPGYKGKDCTTPICQEHCSPGYICTSPDFCTVDPLVFDHLNVNRTDTNGTSTSSFNSTDTNSTNPNNYDVNEATNSTASESLNDTSTEIPEASVTSS